MFIKLTGTDGKFVYVNAQQIVAFFDEMDTCALGNTSIELPFSHLTVMETPEEIMNLIKESEEA